VTTKLLDDEALLAVADTVEQPTIPHPADPVESRKTRTARTARVTRSKKK